jgi:hypothetical protein
VSGFAKPFTEIPQANKQVEKSRLIGGICDIGEEDDELLTDLNLTFCNVHNWSELMYFPPFTLLCFLSTSTILLLQRKRVI